MTEESASGSNLSDASTTPRRVLVMPEAFAATDKEDWVSWLKYFDESLSRAIQLEAIYEAENGLSRSKTSRVQTVEKSGELRIAEMLNKQTAALEKAVNWLSEHAKTGGNNDHRKSGSKFRGNKKTCWKCGGVGHFKAKCPTQDESSQKQGN